MNVPPFARPATPTFSVIASFLAASTTAIPTVAAPTVGTVTIDRTVLRIALSKDGLAFKENDGVFLTGANSPTIAQMKNGNLIVMVDYSGDDGKRTTLSVTRSESGGKSWSPLRPINLRAPDPVRLTANHASLVRTSNGRLHVFFTSTPVQTRKSSPIMVFSAATRNGLDFRVDRSMRLGLPNSVEAHPMAVAADDRIHLLIERVARGRNRRGNKAVLEHFVSPDGSDFARIAPARFKDLRFVGDVIAFADGYRAYVTTPGGITSLVSKNLRKWKPEKGIRIARGWDPAVTKLSDGTFLMIYCAKAASDAGGRSSVVDTTSYGDDFDATDWIVEAELANEDTIADASPDPDPDPDQDSDADAQSAEAEEANQGDAVEGASAETEAKDWVVDPEHKDDWWSFWDPKETDGFAPPPDFKTKVDYFSWYSDYLLPDPEDNAYDAYAKFMPGLRSGPDGPLEWPALKNMYTDESFKGSPGPWKAEDHPDWAESDDAIQGLLEQFQEASRKKDYAVPPHTDLEFKEEKTDADRLLMNLLLPNLSGHRKISRAALADAWRVDQDGKVSPDRMKSAIETTLRAAEHLDQGQTLIEELVAKSERDKIHDTALRALEQDVFSGDEIEEVLDTLQRLDQPPADPAKGARGEHGFSMDITQYLFSPPTEKGEPKFNRKRAEKVAPFSGSVGMWVGEMSKMTPDDVQASLDAFDRHYKELVDQIRIGYPDVRATDIEAIEAENLHTSPLTEEMMPALSRYYKLEARGEATRRATQLTYAVHLYKKRNGRWPASLDELPARYSAGVRKDPFTGDDFQYELTDKGPRIYSLSENARDDGGKHSPRWDDHPEQNGGSDDYVFWPPQPKR